MKIVHAVKMNQSGMHRMAQNCANGPLWVYRICAKSFLRKFINLSDNFLIGPSHVGK